MPNLNVLPLRHHHEVSARFAPKRNRLLAALPVESYECLLPELEPVELVADSAIYEAGDSERYLYFITAGIVAKFCETQEGKSTACAISGSEGAVGISSFLGGMSMLSRAVVLSPGYAYRLPRSLLRDEVRYNSPLVQLLLRYTLALIMQMAQTAVCNRYHKVKQQVCRWLLLSLDRLPSNELTMTHELIANMLGVRREGVTEAAVNLQAAGVVNYSRGHITVLDRAALERRVCECYAVVKKESARLLLPAYSPVANISAFHRER